MHSWVYKGHSKDTDPSQYQVSLKIYLYFQNQFESERQKSLILEGLLEGIVVSLIYVALLIKKKPAILLACKLLD